MFQLNDSWKKNVLPKKNTIPLFSESFQNDAAVPIVLGEVKIKLEVAKMQPIESRQCGMTG